MKFIISFLFSIFLIAPTWAAYNPGTSDSTCTQYNDITNTTHQTNCIATPGCTWDADYACNVCEANHACTNGIQFSQCTTHPNWPNNTTGIVHPRGASSCSDWVCASGYDVNSDYSGCHLACDNIPEHATLPSGETNCNNWICEANYYKNNNSCSACPDNGTTTSAGITSPFDCGCPSTYDGVVEVSSGNYRCVTCPSGAHYDNSTHTCVCDITGATGITYNSNTASGCTCVSPATNQNGQCDCDDGYSTTITDGVVHCAPCGPNQKSQNGTCVCKERYYGDADGCIQCPSGTKVAIDAEDLLPISSTKANCRAYSGTKFCDANGQNCMKLLQ